MSLGASTRHELDVPGSILRLVFFIGSPTRRASGKTSGAPSAEFLEVGLFPRGSRLL